MSENMVTDIKYYDGIPLQQFLTYRLARLHAKLNIQASRILGVHAGIKLTEWRIIALIGSKSEKTLTEINRASQMDKGQLSRTIRGLLDSGLIQSRSSLNDQRQQLLALTENGRKIYEKTLPKMQTRQHMLMDCLSAEERRLIFSVIDKLEIAADQAVEFASPSTVVSSRKDAG